MAVRRWRRNPGGRLVRWAKSRGDERPGWGTTRFSHWVPPHWYRNTLNRRERRRARAALHGGQEAGRPLVHPRAAGWYW